jgi:hypothetical protein
MIRHGEAWSQASFPAGLRGAAENIAEVCIDLSPAFIKGTAAHLPEARSYRSARNLKAVIYMIAGKLELSLPA